MDVFLNNLSFNINDDEFTIELYYYRAIVGDPV